MEATSLALVFAALAVGSLLKGITGAGLPIVATPVLTYFLGLPHAIAVLMIPIMATNLHQAMTTSDGLHEVRFLWPAIPAGALGLGIGTWFLASTPPEKLNIGLGSMLLVYIAIKLFKPNAALKRSLSTILSPFVGLAAGFAQGATGLSAAVIIPFVQSVNVSRQATIFTISAIFMIFAVIQFFSLIYIGLITWRYILEGLLALIPVALFMPFGSWLGKRLSREAFDKIFLVILAVIAVGLIERGL